jgi:hypothetical protein
MGFKKYITYFFFLLLSYTGLAQDAIPQGKFSLDSIKIGQPVKFILSFYHPKDMEVYFPDSSSNYGAFEFIEKIFSPTKTTDTMSLDIAIYTLTTFDSKDKVELVLPVYSIENGDTIPILSTSDAVCIRKLIEKPVNTLSYKINTHYNEVPFQFNYAYWITGIILFSCVLVFLYFFFGKAIIRNYKLYVMYNNHITFLRSFDALTKQLEESPSISSMEKILVDWKNYLTGLEHIPINTFTSTEIITLFKQEELKNTLQQLDRSIYGGVIIGNSLQFIMELRKFSNDRYKKYRKELMQDE